MFQQFALLGVTLVADPAGHIGPVSEIKKLNSNPMPESIEPDRRSDCYSRI